MENKKVDILELKRIKNCSENTRVQKMIQDLINKEETELNQMVYFSKKTAEENNRIYQGIKTYSFDQESNKVLIYIKLEEIINLEKKNIQINFEKRSFDLKIQNYRKKNLRLKIEKLEDQIIPEKSSMKIKKNYVILKMTKQNMGKWNQVYYKKVFNAREHINKKDPQKGLMDMMKKMYNQGDSNMKKTISEAFTKSLEEQSKK